MLRQVPLGWPGPLHACWPFPRPWSDPLKVSPPHPLRRPAPLLPPPNPHLHVRHHPPLGPPSSLPLSRTSAPPCAPFLPPSKQTTPRGPGGRHGRWWGGRKRLPKRPHCLQRPLTRGKSAERRRLSSANEASSRRSATTLQLQEKRHRRPPKGAGGAGGKWLRGIPETGKNGAQGD